MDDTSSSPPRVLVIDDEESMRHALGRSLKRAGFRVAEAATGREGLECFGDGDVDAVVTDMRLPDLDGLDLVAIFTQRSPSVPVLVMTGYGSVDAALEAMRRGARDFVQKPFAMEDLVRQLVRVLKEHALSEENRRLRALVERRFAKDGYAQVEQELRALEGDEGADGAGDGVGHEAWTELPAKGDAMTLREAHHLFEVRYVEDLLARTGGNIAAAARLAGISRPNFHKKLKSLDIDATKYKDAARRGRASDL